MVREHEFEVDFNSRKFSQLKFDQIRSLKINIGHLLQIWVGLCKGSVEDIRMDLVHQVVLEVQPLGELEENAILLKLIYRFPVATAYQLKYLDIPEKHRDILIPSLKRKSVCFTIFPHQDNFDTCSIHRCKCHQPYFQVD